VYRWELTPHERRALLSLMADYICRPDATQVSIDAESGEEIEYGLLLDQLMMLDPLETEPEEAALIEAYRELPPATRSSLIGLLRAMAARLGR
jgi:hypothetical protein